MTSVDVAATLSTSQVVVTSSSPCPAGPEIVRHMSVGDGGNEQSCPLDSYIKRSFVLISNDVVKR